jgi:hypothetical protein
MEYPPITTNCKCISSISDYSLEILGEGALHASFPLLHSLVTKRLHLPRFGSYSPEKWSIRSSEMQLHTLPFDLHLRGVTDGLTPLPPPRLAATEPLYFAKHLQSDGTPRWAGSNPVRLHKLPNTFANSKYPFPRSQHRRLIPSVSYCSTSHSLSSSLHSFSWP